MIEPTESESKQECDLFIDAMRSIAEEAEPRPNSSRPPRTTPASAAWMKSPQRENQSCDGSPLNSSVSRVGIRSCSGALQCAIAAAHINDGGLKTAATKASHSYSESP